MFYSNVIETTNYIKQKIKCRPSIAIILGSGLSGITNNIKNKEELNYKDIPHFLNSKIQGHEYKLTFGEIGKNKIVALQGRFHYYEGYNLKDITFPIYVLKMLGIKTLIITNACGGINTSFNPGDLMIISDHLNISGLNPLIGDNDERFGPRFPDMSEIYSKRLIKLTKDIASKNNISVKEGVYAFYTGPSYETSAEIKAYSILGADAIGMSTIPEAIVGNYLNLEILGISCITNMATGITKNKHSHEEVLQVAATSSQNLCILVSEVIKNC